MARHSKGSSAQSNEQPSIIWRILNLIAALCMCARMYQLVVSELDWWIWVPVYAFGASVSMAVVLQPGHRQCFAWRYMTGLTIVLGTAYMAYTVWVVRDVASAAFILNGGDLMEGRELAIMCAAVGWTVLNRMAAHRLNSFANLLRFVLFMGVLCALMFMSAYSACFYKEIGDQVPFCQGILNPTIIWGSS